MNDQSKGRNGQNFKRSLDKQNRLETKRGPSAKHERDQAEGQAAKSGLPHLEKHSKGRPKQDD